MEASRFENEFHASTIMLFLRRIKRAGQNFGYLFYPLEYHVVTLKLILSLYEESLPKTFGVNILESQWLCSSNNDELLSAQYMKYFKPGFD